jgi:hypothetical protein
MKVFIIDGGAGRAIASMPALRKYARLNPDSNFYIFTYWDSLFYGDPVLHSKCYPPNTKGFFHNIVKNNEIVHPEPYFLKSYYNQETSLAEAFDEIINCTTDHSDLNEYFLAVTEPEKNFAVALVNELKQRSGTDKVIVYQPFGSGCNADNGVVTDVSNRSLKYNDALDLACNLSERAAILYFGPQFIPDNHPKIYNLFHHSPDLRMFSAVISQCDLFVGIDSVGQHMARAHDKPGVIVLGSTFEKNVSYADYDKFTFYRRKKHLPEYVPLRISDFEMNLANIVNSMLMNFNEKDLKKIRDAAFERLK